MDGGPNKDGSAFSLSVIELLGRFVYTVSVWMVISKEFSGGPLFIPCYVWMDFFGLCPTLPVSVRESKKECVV